MTRDELLRALTVERYTNPWWKTAPTVLDDSELTRGIRRRELVEADADYRKRLGREAADKSYDSLGIENAVVIVQRILTNRIAAERGPRIRPAEDAP